MKEKKPKTKQTQLFIDVMMNIVFLFFFVALSRAQNSSIDWQLSSMNKVVVS